MFPIITLTTDFGTRDSYVAAMKAVLLQHCPAARLIDITHEIPRHDILRGSFNLERALAAFPAGTIHLAVVDPGVGGDRKILIAEIHGQKIVCPDNGLITWPWRRLGGGETFELTWRPPTASSTFHGRDIMAPVAAQIANGRSMHDFAVPLASPVLLDIAPAAPDAHIGRVIYLDVFGNATTNISSNAARLASARAVFVNGRNVGPLRRTYSDVPPGELLALIGSSDLLEIAAREGSAAVQLHIKVGDEVRLD
jgi:S-adenosyl-L-methionine hydrolase (adenosine-forming)